MEFDFDGEENASDLLTRISKLTRNPGRTASLDKQTLVLRRNNLLGFLDGFWGEIGWELQTAKTIHDIRTTLSVAAQNTPPFVRLFTRNAPNLDGITSTELRLKTLKLEVLNKRLHLAALERDRTQELLDKAKRAMVKAKDTKQGTEINEVLATYKTKVKIVKRTYRALLKQQRSLETQSADEQAYFVQAELLRLIQSGRYSFTPLNLANAMAGLPEMGCRQSVKLCRKEKPRFAEYPNHWLFKLLKACLNQLGSQPLSVANCAKAKLQGYRGKDSYLAEAVKKNWYHLRRAIEITAGQKRHPGTLPYRIVAQYHENLAHQTPVDVFREEEGQL